MEIRPAHCLANRYVIKKYICGGAVGEVYVALDLQATGSSKVIAVKACRSKNEYSEKEKKGSVIAMSASHTNLLKIFDISVSVCV